MSDFINLVLPRIIPLVASQDAAVAKRSAARLDRSISIVSFRWHTHTPFALQDDYFELRPLYVCVCICETLSDWCSNALIFFSISDSLVHLASNVLGCVVSMQCIVEPLVALFGKLGSEHAVTAIDAIGISPFLRFFSCPYLFTHPLFLLLPCHSGYDIAPDST